MGAARHARRRLERPDRRTLGRRIPRLSKLGNALARPEQQQDDGKHHLRLEPPRPRSRGRAAGQIVKWSKTMDITINPEIEQKARTRAESEGLTVQAYVERLILADDAAAD